jgi:hypothetical protein
MILSLEMDMNCSCNFFDGYKWQCNLFKLSVMLQDRSQLFGCSRYKNSVGYRTVYPHLFLGEPPSLHPAGGFRYHAQRRAHTQPSAR